MNEWIGSSPEEYEWEDRYIAECTRLGLTPYRCRAIGCDRAIPCRRHKDEPDVLDPDFVPND